MVQVDPRAPPDRRQVPRSRQMGVGVAEGGRGEWQPPALSRHGSSQQ